MINYPSGQQRNIDYMRSYEIQLYARWFQTPPSLRHLKGTLAI